MKTIDRLCIVGSALLVSGTLFGFRHFDDVPKEVVAHSFRMVDESGKNRIVMTATPNGSTAFSMLGEKGTEGSCGILLRVNQAGDCFCDLLPPSGSKGGVTIGMSKDGSSRIYSTDSHNHTRFKLGLTKDGSPSLELFDDEGRLRLCSGAVETEVENTGKKATSSESSVTFFDRAGKVLLQIPK